MAFVHPLWLVLLIAPAAWLLYDWPRTIGKSRLIVKVMSVALIVTALAEPRINFQKTKVAVAVLADTSASLTPSDLQRASEIATAIQSSRGTNVTEVIPFARSPRAPQKSELNGKAWHFERTPGEAGRATNLERAVSEAVASLPAGLIRRVVLISDGNENSGSIVRATWQAQQLGIPIDTYALNGRAQPGLRLDSVSIPGQVFSGEKFPVDLTVESPSSTHATVELTAEGKSLGHNSVDLTEGQNQVRVRASLNSSGALDLAGKITADRLGEARFEQAVTVRRARALLLSQDPPGTDIHLTNVLDANQFDFDRNGAQIPKDLSNYQLLIFNNLNMDAIPLADQTRIENFEKEGGGLLWISGEHNIYVDRKGAPETPVERAFPAKLAPPRSPEGTCVILIIDKSSSMEGKKMDLARAASIGVVQNLRPIDLVGVLIFDNSFQWAVPVRKAEDRSLIARLISGITPDGGTQIAPALQEAYTRVHNINAVYKHIVLLTDGISEEGDSLTLSKEAAANNVTISTVGLGQDVNRAYLEKVAEYANGKSYFLNDPAGLEQILLKDVQEHTGTTAVEKPLKPVISEKADLLDGVGIDTAPVLFGYVRFQTKPGADQLLGIDRDPLFVRWQNGLGRAAVFASDAKARWSANWVTWPGFDKFWSNVARDLLPHAPPSEAVAGYDAASGAVTVSYRLGNNVEDPETIPDIFIFGPDGFRQTIKVTKTSAGNYHGEAIVGQRQGLFRIRPLNESRAFPEVGIYRQEAELSDYGSNQFLLKSIAASTGGRFNPPVGAVFDNGGRSIDSTMELWPGLLGLAVLLNLVELVMRKWKGLAEALRPHPSARRRMIAQALWLAVAMAAAPNSISTIQDRFHKIEIGAYPPGSRVPISIRDLNPYLNFVVHFSVPSGLRNIHIETGSNNIIRGTADIDFLKIRQAQGEKPGWLLSQLLGGERPVEVTARLTSADGVAKVDVLKVSISGFVAEGATLDFLITTFVLPNFPEAKVGTNFRLDYNIDHFDIQPGQVIVVLRAVPSPFGNRMIPGVVRLRFTR